jgi:nucleoside-diphosphate-sugar epimerase
MEKSRHLFVFGLGYSALHAVSVLRPAFASCAGTVRTAGKKVALQEEAIQAFLFDAEQEAISKALQKASHVLITVPPGETGDPVLSSWRSVLEQSQTVRWIGYLSSIAVYGDQQGGWVDEVSPTCPCSPRGRARLAAEQDWQHFAAHTGKGLALLRLPGIYGPGRNALEALKEGTVRRILKPGQVFNRIHVADIAQTLLTAMTQEATGIFNVTDDEPAPPQDVMAYAAELLGLAPPPLIPFDADRLSPMAASFYSENKRVASSRLKTELGVTLHYPTYREGLGALLADMPR